MVNMPKRQQPHTDENCQLKATLGSSMNDEENSYNIGQAAAHELATKQHRTQLYTAATLNQSENKTIQTLKFLTSGKTQKNTAGLKYFGLMPSPNVHCNIIKVFLTTTI